MNGLNIGNPTLLRFAQLESNMNPYAKNPNSSAKGLLQFIDSTARDYGITAEFGTPEYTAQEIEAGERLLNDNKQYLRTRLGREPTEGELYLAHQQGAKGAADLLTNASARAADLVGEDAISLNAGRPDMTAGDFAAQWTSKLDGQSGGTTMAEMTIEQKRALAVANARRRQQLGVTDFNPQASDEISPQVEQEMSWSDALKEAGERVLRQGLQGATFGFADEIIDPAASYVASKVTGVPYDVILADARDSTKRDLAEDWEEAPVLSAGANIAGGILTGGGLVSGAKTLAPKATGAVINAVKAAPKTAAFLSGAGSGGLYSAGQAEGDISERLDDFGTGAMWGGPFGVAGYGVARGVSRAGSAAAEKYGPIVAPYINKAEETVSPVFRTGGRRAAGVLDDIVPDQAADDLISPNMAAQNADDITPTRLAGILDEEDLAQLERGRTVPMTKGDRTQDVVLQRREQIAAEAGSEPILKARAQQQEAARKPFVRALGDDATPDDLDLRLLEQSQARDAADVLRGEYDDLGRKVNKAYETAKETGRGVALSGQTVSDDLIGSIDDTLFNEAYRKGDIPALDKNLDELRQLVGSTGDEASPASIKALENWKKRLNSTIGNTPADQKDTLRKLKLVSRQYDNFLTNVADDAIINGDDKAIKAFKEARSLAKQKFDFYEGDRAIQRILDERELSGEQLVNIITGAEKLSGKGSDGMLVSKMLSRAGEKAPEMREAIKKGVMAKAFRRGLVKNTADPANPEQALVSFSKMRTEVGNLMAKKELFEAVFDANEQQFMRQFYDDLRLVASKQKGAINNSSTGIWTAEFAKGLGKVFNNPLIRSNPLTGVPGQFIDDQFQRYAAQQITGNAEKGLSEFIEQQINSINAPAAYYGSIGATSVGPQGVWDILMYEDDK